MTEWLIGFGLGMLATVPLVLLASRRTAARVRRLERRAQAAERLAEQATLTGGLAHEIKNPLSTIGLNLQLLEEDLQELAESDQLCEPHREKIGRLQRRFSALHRELHRLREILEDFLRFAGRVRLDRTPADVNTMVSELVDFYLPQAEMAKVRVRAQLDAQPAQAWIDPPLLKQALLNLLINATQAMIDAREAGRAHGGASELILRTARRQGDLLIQVIDTGPGIPPDHAERVFQPYFSTKRGGTGLGLPTTRRIVEEHGGTIGLHSEPGRGTEFTITLPITAPAPAPGRDAVPG